MGYSVRIPGNRRDASARVFFFLVGASLPSDAPYHYYGVSMELHGDVHLCTLYSVLRRLSVCCGASSVKERDLPFSGRMLLSQYGIERKEFLQLLCYHNVLESTRSTEGVVSRMKDSYPAFLLHSGILKLKKSWSPFRTRHVKC